MSNDPDDVNIHENGIYMIINGQVECFFENSMNNKTEKIEYFNVLK